MTDRVVDQVAHDPAERRRVAPDVHPGRGVEGQRDAGGRGDRSERLDRLVGDLGQIHRHRVQVEAAALDAGEQEEIVDQRRQRLDVAAHRAEVAVGIGRHAIGQGVDGDPQRRQRCAEVVTDARKHRVAFGRVAGPLPLERVEADGELVERHGDVAQLVAAVDAGAHRAVTLLDPPDGCLQLAYVAAERDRGEHHEHRRHHCGHAEDRGDPRQLGRVEDHQAGEQDGGEGADRQRGERDREHLASQRPRPPGEPAQAEGGGDRARREAAEREDRLDRLVGDRVPPLQREHGHPSNR